MKLMPQIMERDLSVREQLEIIKLRENLKEVRKRGDKDLYKERMERELENLILLNEQIDDNDSDEDEVNEKRRVQLEIQQKQQEIEDYESESDHDSLSIQTSEIEDKDLSNSESECSQIIMLKEQYKDQLEGLGQKITEANL